MGSEIAHLVGERAKSANQRSGKAVSDASSCALSMPTQSAIFSSQKDRKVPPILKSLSQFQLLVSFPGRRTTLLNRY